MASDTLGPAQRRNWFHHHRSGPMLATTASECGELTTNLAKPSSRAPVSTSIRIRRPSVARAASNSASFVVGGNHDAATLPSFQIESVPRVVDADRQELCVVEGRHRRLCHPESDSDSETGVMPSPQVLFDCHNRPFLGGDGSPRRGSLPAVTSTRRTPWDVPPAVCELCTYELTAGGCGAARLLRKRTRGRKDYSSRRC